MKCYEVYTARRKALKLTQLELSKLADIRLLDVVNFEKGELVDKEVFNKIKDTIYLKFKSLDYVDHVKARIIETALRISDETDNDQLLKDISHMMIELGKLQGDIMGFESGRGYK